MRTPLVKPLSLAVLFSYVLDWVVIIALGLISYGFNKLTPHYHPFSLLDLSISYPYVEELITTRDLVLAAVVGPIVIVFIVSFLFVPGIKSTKQMPWRLLIRRKLWELNTGWLGLGLSITTSLVITAGMKAVIGKPRPNALARCDPDPAAVSQNTVGGYGAEFNALLVLVDQTICRQTDKAALNDGFVSFPSGHASTSWSGLFYLTLYMCSKFSIVFPYLPGESLIRGHGRSNGGYASVNARDPRSIDTAQRPMLGGGGESENPYLTDKRDEAAAPPLYLLFLMYVPIGVALFISGTRYFDYRHHGFDIIAGSVIGIATSIFAFRLYHLPMTRGAGWSWGPRSRTRAFGVGIGSHGYVDEERLMQAGGGDDVELGAMTRKQGGRAEHLGAGSNNDGSGTRFQAPLTDGYSAGTAL